MGIGAGGAAAGHDAFVGGEEQRDSGGGEEAEARLTTSLFAVGSQSVEDEARSRNIALDGVRVSIQCTRQPVAVGSGSVSCGLRFAAAARLSRRGHLRWECGRAEERQGR